MQCQEASPVHATRQREAMIYTLSKKGKRNAKSTLKPEIKYLEQYQKLLNSQRYRSGRALYVMLRKLCSNG
jgi:hypothetical protein